MELTLTVQEIIDLAEFAGCIVTGPPPDTDTEITVALCPEEGVLDEDAGTREHCRFVAYLAEYPDEGCYPLGESSL